MSPKRRARRVGFHSGAAVSARPVLGSFHWAGARAQGLGRDGIGVRHVVQVARLWLEFTVGFVNFQNGVADANGGMPQGFRHNRGSREKMWQLPAAELRK